MRAISPAEARVRATSGSATLVDIREEYEASTARVESAVRIPLGMLLADPGRAPRMGPVIVMDHEGTRARFAAEYLRRHGVDATPVEGGALAFLGR